MIPARFGDTGSGRGKGSSSGIRPKRPGNAGDRLVGRSRPHGQRVPNATMRIMLGVPYFVRQLLAQRHTRRSLFCTISGSSPSKIELERAAEFC